MAFVVLLIRDERGAEVMKCPICDEPTKWKGNPDRPFCSERCRLIDLGNWASEEYRVSLPVHDVDESAKEQQD
jgi:endogenous inhibitor of DNA gyrase (YacG/DUF329 family)